MVDPHNVNLQKKNLDLSQKLDQVLKLEEIKWVQKSRQNWTQLGDRNNRYFQTITLNRRRKNRIWKIRDSDGLWFDKQNEIARVFINDFSKRFKSERPRMIPKWFDSFNPCISEEENRDLIKEVIEEEILATLSQMSSLKALGPDRLQATSIKSIGRLLENLFVKWLELSSTMGIY